MIVAVDVINDKARVSDKCNNCGNLELLHRHHIGSDKFFTRYDYVLQERYDKFRDEDIDPICPDCHEKYHYVLRRTALLITLTRLIRKARLFDLLTTDYLWSLRNSLVKSYEFWKKDPIHAELYCIDLKKSLGRELSLMIQKQIL